jgi:hypothetical protein
MYYCENAHHLLSRVNSNADNADNSDAGPDPINDFLKSELDVRRLNDIHSWLWLAGTPMPARPLHRQKMMRRKIVITEQVDLHLVWHESFMYVKPLPTYLLSRQFREERLRNNEDLYKSAWGFVTSYAWLVCYESDFQIAKDLHLLPSELMWSQWKGLLGEFLQNSGNDTLNSSMVNKRYLFGELRLSRLNMIYRFAPKFQLRYLIRGYYYGYSQYGNFFKHNFAWLFTVFAYVTIIIIAMTLGLTTDRLKGDTAFQNASYGFAVFSVIVPVIVISVMIFLFLVLFMNNFIAAHSFRKKRRMELGIASV